MPAFARCESRKGYWQPHTKPGRRSTVKVVLAGGSGHLGRRIATDLSEHGHDVVILTRKPRADFPTRQVPWDGTTVGDWKDELRQAAVINLAGAIVDRPPTPRNIEILTSSRVDPTLALTEAVKQLGAPAPVWLQMSTLAIYGHSGDAAMDESAPVPTQGPPQMTGVAVAWEQAADAVSATRKVVLRTGMVLDKDFPIMDRLTGLTRWGLGGRIGNGHQWVSWIHIDDFLAVVRRCLEDSQLSDVVHVTGPHPVRNVTLMSSLRTVMRRPPSPPAPAPLVKLGARVLRTDPDLALTGRHCVPGKLMRAGFEFRHPKLLPALRDLLR